MKIYPSNHLITETKNVERDDIPVSYIMTNTNSYEIKIEKTNFNIFLLIIHFEKI